MASTRHIALACKWSHKRRETELNKGSLLRKAVKKVTLPHRVWVSVGVCGGGGQSQFPCFSLNLWKWTMHTRVFHKVIQIYSINFHNRIQDKRHFEKK